MIPTSSIKFGLIVYVKYWTWWATKAAFKKKYGSTAKRLVVKGEVVKVDRDMACAWICFPSLAKTSKVAMSYFNKSYVSTAIPVKENLLTLSKVVEKEGGSILSCLEKGFRDSEVFKCHGGEIMKDPSSPPALTTLD